MTRILPAAILPLAVVLLQYHSIAFWTWAITGEPITWRLALLAAPWNGWGWSVLFELVNLWAWPRRWWTVATVTTLLLVAGPLYQVSDPLVRELVAPAPAELNETPRIRALRGEIAELERTLATYREDWRLRPRIPEAQAELRQRNEQLGHLLAEREAAAGAARLDWRRWAVIMGQLLGIVVAQVSAVLSILALFGRRGPPAPAPGKGTVHWHEEWPRRAGKSAVQEAAVTAAESAGRNVATVTPNSPPNTAANDHRTAERPERAAMLAYARRHGLRSQGQVADAIAEHRSTFSEFVNGRANDEQRARIMAALEK